MVTANCIYFKNIFKTLMHFSIYLNVIDAFLVTTRHTCNVMKQRLYEGIRGKASTTGHLSKMCHNFFILY